MHEGVFVSNVMNMHKLLATAKFVAIGCRPDAADSEYDLLVSVKSLVTLITQSCEQCHDMLVTIKCHLTSNINNN